MKVLGDDGLGSFGVMINALDWVLTQKSNRGNNPTVVSMSIAGGFYKNINDMVEAVVDEGVIVVVAAGNSGADACDFSPSSASVAITVGASKADDTVSYFSNHGACVEIYAPGSKIISVNTGSSTGYSSCQ